MLEKYELALDISPLPMLLVSQGGEIVLANEGVAKLFGYAKPTMAGMSVEVLIPESSRHHHPELRRSYFTKPSKRMMGVGRELQGITQSGEIIPLELALEPVFIEDQTMAMVVLVDISQRKAYEKQLRQATDASASAMIMIDEKGVIVLANAAANAMFGFDLNELVGTAIDNLVPESARRTHPGYRRSYFNTGVKRSMGINQGLTAVRKDGTVFPVEVALTPFENTDGKMVMSTILDLTERVETERMMAQKAKELEALNTDLSQFAYSASHDLKAPVATISGLLDICVEDLDSGNLTEMRDNLIRTQQICTRSAERIEAVLRIAHTSREKITPEKLELGKLIESIWLDINAASTNDIELTLDLNHDQVFFTEVPALQVVLENILTNAIRYQDSNKQYSFINITSTNKNNMLTISITDNGIGIPESKHHLLFTMFKRIDHRSLNGLGLTLAKKQVERLGGSISFTSQSGEGTQFSFSIAQLKTSEQ